MLHETPPAMTAATGRSSRSPWKDQGSPRARHKPSTTPNGFPPGRTPASVGQSTAPRLSPNPASGRSAAEPPRTVSPGYFGLVVDPGAGSPVDSDAGVHARANWKSASSSIASKAAASPQPVPHEQNPDLAEFRRQSEAYAFSLGNLHRLNSASNAPSAPSPLARMVEQSQSDGYFPTSSPPSSGASSDAPNDKMEVDDWKENEGEISPKNAEGAPRLSINGLMDPIRSPGPEQRLSRIDERQHRLSLTQNRVEQPSPTTSFTLDARANSMPQSLNQDGPSIISPEDFADLYDIEHPTNLLVLDLRVAPQYSKARIRGALNLCIPTTLLKRPSFSIPRLSDAFTQTEEKIRFSRWNEVEYIAVYDAASSTIRDATSAVNTLRKFVNEGWTGVPYIVRGGFQAVSKQFPRLVEKPDAPKVGGLNKKGLKLMPGGGNGGGGGGGGGDLQVAGGCPLPAEKSAANPFFGNIRQNMDLIGGVGQIEITLPEAVNSRTFVYLPSWLQRATVNDDKGKRVSEKFLEIEKAEQERMQNALSGDVRYGTPEASGSDAVRVAGIEKGTKNRYKDILPFEHSRVKLENVEEGGCDYINASYLKAEWSHRRYIATQAPVPETFEDFWRLVWDQDVRVIVMLTAEMEGNQQKAHSYWVAGDYGPMKVKALAEKRVALIPPPSAASKLKRAQMGSPLERPTVTRRRGVTNPLGLAHALQETSSSATPTGDTEISQVLVRKLTLHHTSHPFEPLREITQLHFTQWPDFGSIAAQDVLGLVEQCNNVTRVQHSQSQQQQTYLHPHGVTGAPTNPLLPVPEGERPILVHCSAGCGRTGTFCTIDSVIDMLKRQRLAKRRQAVSSDQNGDVEMDMDESDWVFHDETDLIAKAVEDFRLQRLSIVQTLKQYVLCYEAIVEWWVKQNPDKFLKDHVRRSSQG